MARTVTTPRPARDDAAASADPLLRDAAIRLAPRAGDVPTGRLEAEVLLAFVLGTTRAGLLALPGVSSADRTRFDALVAEREATARPVAYLTGRRAFAALDLAVGTGVLVPRPETEHLVELFVELDQEGAIPPGPVVDRGTGSGAIALAVADACGAKRRVVACDLSAAALRIAARNVRALEAEGQVALVRGDGLSPFGDDTFAAVLVNPPYVEPGEWDGLPTDVRDHEPRMALVPAQGSVSAMYTSLLGAARRVLKPGGWFVTEVGDGQASTVAGQARADGWECVTVRADLAGIERVVAARA